MGGQGSKDDARHASGIALANSLVSDTNAKSQVEKVHQFRQLLTDFGESPVQESMVKEMVFGIKPQPEAEEKPTKEKASKKSAKKAAKEKDPDDTVDSTAFFQCLLQLVENGPSLDDQLYVLELVNDLCQFAPDDSKQFLQHLLTRLGALCASLLTAVTSESASETREQEEAMKDVKRLQTLLTVIQNLAVRTRFCSEFLESGGHVALNVILSRPELDKASVLLAGMCLESLSYVRPFPLEFCANHNTTISYMLNNPYLKAAKRHHDALRVLGAAFAIVAQYTHGMHTNDPPLECSENGKRLVGAGMLPRLLQGYRRLRALQTSCPESENNAAFKDQALSAEYHLSRAVYHLLDLDEAATQFPSSQAEIVLAAVDHATRRRTKVKPKEVSHRQLQQIDTIESCFMLALHKVTQMSSLRSVLVSKGLFKVLLNALVSIHDPPRNASLVRTRLAAAHCLRNTVKAKHVDSSIHLLQHSKFPILLLHLRPNQDPAYLLQLLQLLYNLVNVKLDVQANPAYLMVLCTVVGAPCGLLAGLMQNTTPPNQIELLIFKFCVAIIDCVLRYDEGAFTVQIQGVLSVQHLSAYMAQHVANNSSSAALGQRVVQRLVSMGASCTSLSQQDSSSSAPLQPSPPPPSSTTTTTTSTTSNLTTSLTPTPPQQRGETQTSGGFRTVRAPNTSPSGRGLAPPSLSPAQLLLTHGHGSPTAAASAANTFPSTPPSPVHSNSSSTLSRDSSGSILCSPSLLSDDQMPGSPNLSNYSSPACSRSPSTMSEMTCSTWTPMHLSLATDRSCSEASTFSMNFSLVDDPVNLGANDDGGDFTQEDTTVTTTSTSSTTSSAIAVPAQSSAAP